MVEGLLDWLSNFNSWPQDSSVSSAPLMDPLRGQTLVTKSLKAELPKALALDGALVDEGASGGL